MRKRLIPLLAAPFLGLAVGFLYAPPPEASLPFRSYRDDNFARFKPRLLDDHPGARFDATFAARFSAPSDEDAIRLFFDAQDDKNYGFVQISPNDIEAFRVEGGLMHSLGSKGIAPALDGRDARFVLRRRDYEITVLKDGIPLLSFADPALGDGRIGAGATGDAEVDDPVVQPVASTLFTDDFMRATSDPGAWEGAGGASWEVRSLDNPARSSNAFVLQGHGKAGAYLVGAPYWDAYRAEVSVLGPPDGAVGLLVSCGDGGGSVLSKGCLVRWSAGPLPEGAAGTTGSSSEGGSEGQDGTPTTLPGDELAGGGEEKSKAGTLQIVKITDGVETVLAETGTGYQPNRWYRLSAVLSDGAVRAFIDGAPVLSVPDPVFGGGRAGLYVRSDTPAEFDDFRVTGIRVDRNQTDWSDGLMGVEEKPLRDRPCVLFSLTTEKTDAIQLAARLEWAGFHYGFAGLVAAWQSPIDYVAVEIDKAEGKRRLVRYEKGNRAVLDETSFNGAPPESVSLTVDRGFLHSDGLSAYLPDLRAGLVGVLKNRPAYTQGPSKGTAREGREAMAFRIAAFHATELPPPLPVDTINEIFDEERLMAVWSGTAGDWREGDAGGAFNSVYWHRALLFGDAEIEASLPETRDPDHRLALSLAKPAPGDAGYTTPRNGYTLLLQGDAGGSASVALIRQGKEVARTELPPGSHPLRLRLRQAAPFVVGCIDDRPVLHWRDEAPLRGPRVAYAVGGMEVAPEKVTLFSRTLLSESFNRAPADWRVGAGVWQITNRWECDPRWSFMAGMPPGLAGRRIRALESAITPEAAWLREMLAHQLDGIPDKEGKLTALWHKRAFEGDQLMEAFIGPVMDRGQRGGYQKYVKNFCLTLCGDGVDVTSGYAFLFGGWDNTKSAIVRNGEVVAAAPSNITKDHHGGINIHRSWFRLRAERRNGAVRFRVFLQRDRGKEPDAPMVDLYYEDPDPLPGGRVAVWSYDCGILAARLRVSAETLGPPDDPFDPPPPSVVSLYESEADGIDKGDDGEGGEK